MHKKPFQAFLDTFIFFPLWPEISEIFSILEWVLLWTVIHTNTISHPLIYQSVDSLNTIMKCDKMQIYLSSNLKLNLFKITLKSELVEDYISTTSSHVSGSMFCSLSLFFLQYLALCVSTCSFFFICSHKTDKKTFDLKYIFWFCDCQVDQLFLQERYINHSLPQCPHCELFHHYHY